MSAAAVTQGRGGRRLFDWAKVLGDGAVLRTAFFAMLFGTFGVLYIDYRELTEADTTALIREQGYPKSIVDKHRHTRMATIASSAMVNPTANPTANPVSSPCHICIFR